MYIKYAQDTEGSVKISNENIKVTPIVIDYSGSYKYNQYSAVGLIETEVQFTAPDVKYISDESITTDNIVITNEIDQFGNPLFYQYQPKYDCLYPDNIRVYDEKDQLIPFKIEYGYVSTLSHNLKDNNSVLFDPLDGHTLYGIIDTPLTFTSIDAFVDLPYRKYGSCLYDGSYIYRSELIDGLDANIFSISYLVRSDVGDFPETSLVETSNGTIKIRKTAGNSFLDVNINGLQSIAILSNVWYRIDYHYTATSSSIVLHNLTTLTSNTYNFTGVLFGNEDVYISANINFACTNVGFFNDDIADSEQPIHLGRYNKTIEWDETEPISSPYRIRLLFRDNKPAKMIYDAVNEDGNLLQNRTEEINYNYVLTKATSYSTNEWIWNGNQVQLTGFLYDEIITGDKIYIYPIIENEIGVHHDLIDNKIHITAGFFRHDDYDGLSNGYYYQVDEYEEMPFTADNQDIIEPKRIKVVKERANLLTPYKIQISRFYIEEGSYPDYIIPNIYEIERFYDNADILHRWTSGVEVTHITARGINIFKNDVLLNNSRIENYDMYNGTVTLKDQFNADDKIEVTYIKDMPDYILTYPLLNPLVKEEFGGIGSQAGFRIYIRPQYANYEIDNPLDIQNEKLCYKFLVNGQPTGDFRSCKTNYKFNQYIIDQFEDYIIPLADVYITTDRSFTDLRERGGGITEAAKVNFTKWPSFLDIGYGIDGKLVYKNIIFVKIPTSVVDDLTTKYFTNNRADTILYIKESIEKFIAAGAFYIVLDENGNMWENPYPSYKVEKFT